MTFKMKLFAILWLAGMVGVLSILLIDLSAVIAASGDEDPANHAGPEAPNLGSTGDSLDPRGSTRCRAGS